MIKCGVFADKLVDVALTSALVMFCATLIAMMVWCAWSMFILL